MKTDSIASVDRGRPQGRAKAARARAHRLVAGARTEAEELDDREQRAWEALLYVESRRAMRAA